MMLLITVGIMPISGGVVPVPRRSNMAAMRVDDSHTPDPDFAVSVGTKGCEVPVVNRGYDGLDVAIAPDRGHTRGRERGGEDVPGPRQPGIPSVQDVGGGTEDD